MSDPTPEDVGMFHMISIQGHGDYVRFSDYEAIAARLAEVAALLSGRTFTVDEGREWKARAEATHPERSMT